VTITNGYLSLQEAQDYIGAQFADSAGIIDDVVTAASRAVDRFCGRHFYRAGTQGAPVARYFDATSPSLLRLGTYNDLTTLVTLKSDDNGDGTYETTWSASNYQLAPVGATARAPQAEPFTEIRLLNGFDFEMHVPSGRTGLIEVSGVWGWPSVPAEVTQATRIIVAELAKLKDAPFGVAGNELTGVMYAPRDMPSAAKRLLRPYVHPDHVGIG
jgi:hypothetical protein